MLLIAVALTFLADRTYAGDYLLVPTPTSCPPGQPSWIDAKAIATIQQPAKFKADSPAAIAKYFVSGKDSLSKYSSALLVDVRPSQETQKFWVPNAIHVQPAFLESNALIHTVKSVLLIGDGKSDQALLDIVQKHAAGDKYFPHIVVGGLPAWYRAGGAVAGNTALLDAPTLIDEREVHELLKQNAAVAAMDGLSLAELKALKKPTIIVASETPQRVIASLRRKGIQQVPTIIVLPSEVTADEWNRVWLRAFQATPYLFIDSGNRYASYLAQQSEIAANAGKPLKHRCDLH